MDRRQFNLQFSIYVEGMEIVPSEPRAIERKSFSLKCRWKYPRHVDPSWDIWSWWHQRDRIDEIDWIWSATPHVNSSSPEELSYHNFSRRLGAQEVGWINSRMRTVPFQGFYESTLTIKNLTREASGRFKCTFRYKRDNGNQGYFAAAYEMNVLGRATKSFRSNLNNSASNTGTTYCTSIGISILVVVILMGLLSGSIYLSKKKRWGKLVQVNLEQLIARDNLENGDPGIPLEEQTGLLPNYDPRWEFPRDRIILGKKLGSGHFGVVVQASQIGSVHDPKDYRVRTVAVKMIKSTFNPASLESLATELKILIHLGPHINVVNLLGACTRNILAGELLIIEEFCMYGSIKDFLVVNRESFLVNELDETTLWKLKSYGNLVDAYQDEHQYQEQYRCRMDEPRASSYFSNRPNQNDEEQVALLFDDNEYLLESGKAEANPMLKSGGVITTLDLINWSFQIASGMNHLANKKVIHGDLAARNVLLTTDNVVKIADFGLSRQTNCSDGIYFGEREEALPVKWMAIESLTDHILTAQSDVWSYGVVLWELFSLGQMPYAEVTSLEDLIGFLWSGGRLEKPLLMPYPIAVVMAKCWKYDPKKRPNFLHLERELGNLLEKAWQHENDYLKLKDFYMQMK